MTVRSASLTQIRGLSTSSITKLKQAGVTNTAELLKAASTSTAERALATKAGVPLNELREAVNRADLMQVPGMGPATADLFENAGVNSTKELSHRSASSLAKTLGTWVQAHPEEHHRAPNAQTVASLINGAKAVIAPAPTPVANLTQEQATPVAAAALNRYIDDVLFSNDPEGASYRSMALEGHTQAEQDAIRKHLHDSVNAFLGGTPAMPNSNSEEVLADANGYTFTGRLDGLYTEVTVTKDGKVPHLMVEID